MKYLAVVSLIILSFAFAAFGQKSAKALVVRPDAKKEVQTAFDRLIEGIRQADAKKVMSVYQNSPDILFFNNNGSVTRGWDEMRKNRETLYANTKNVALEPTGVRVEILSPTSAYVTCKWKQTQEYNGKLESASGRMTLVFKLIGKEWKVVHLHTSPDNPDPSRPVFPSERTTNQ
jgi:ketosteroid isomerase-like protein